MRHVAQREPPLRHERSFAAALAAAMILGCLMGDPPPTVAARPNAQAAAEFLANEHGGRAADFAVVYQRPARLPSGETVWAAKLVDRRTGAVSLVYRDAAGTVGDSVVNIAPGQSVTFRSPVAANNVGVHQVDFDGTKPSVCNQTVKTADPVLGPAIPLDTDGIPPVPGFPQPPGWEGYCTFTAPGSYQFVCPVHGGMEGTVVVSAVTTPTPT